MTNKIVFSISFSLFLSASFDVNAQSEAENKFPFLNGYYCDNAIDKNEPIFVISKYPPAEPRALIGERLKGALKP